MLETAKIRHLLEHLMLLGAKKDLWKVANWAPHSSFLLVATLDFEKVRLMATNWS